MWAFCAWGLLRGRGCKKAQQKHLHKPTFHYRQPLSTHIPSQTTLHLILSTACFSSVSEYGTALFSDKLRDTEMWYCQLQLCFCISKSCLKMHTRFLEKHAVNHLIYSHPHLPAKRSKVFFLFNFYKCKLFVSFLQDKEERYLMLFSNVLVMLSASPRMSGFIYQVRWSALHVVVMSIRQLWRFYFSFLNISFYVLRCFWSPHF